MKILSQIFIFSLICLTGQLLNGLFPAIPASIFSLLLLLLLLLLRIIRPCNIREVCEFLLQNMALFFVPAGVAIVNQYHALEGSLWQLLFLCLITTFLTFTVTAYTVIGVTKWIEKARRRKNG